MINIKFINHKNTIKGFEIFGHSGYSSVGTDIVCAAVSSCVYMTINTLTEIYNINCNVEVDSQEGKINFKIINENNLLKCLKILQGLKLHLTKLREMYPKNIKIDYLEV